MNDIPKSSESKHPLLRQLLTPFYRTRMRTAQRRTSTTRENVGKIKAARSAKEEIKELRRKGILK